MPACQGGQDVIGAERLGHGDEMDQGGVAVSGARRGGDAALHLGETLGGRGHGLTPIRVFAHGASWPPLRRQLPKERWGQHPSRRHAEPHLRSRKTLWRPFPSTRTPPSRSAMTTTLPPALSRRALPPVPQHTLPPPGTSLKRHGKRKYKVPARCDRPGRGGSARPCAPRAAHCCPLLPIAALSAVLRPNSRRPAASPVSLAQAAADLGANVW